MRINYRATDRKRMVQVISEALDEKPVYQGIPSYAYQIAEFTVTQEGDLEFPDDTDVEIVNGLLDRREEAGFAFPEDEAASVADRVDTAQGMNDDAGVTAGTDVDTDVDTDAEEDILIYLGYHFHKATFFSGGGKFFFCFLLPPDLSAPSAEACRRHAVLLAPVLLCLSAGSALPD